MARTAGPSDLATPASCTGQADQTGRTGGAKTWGPADRTALKTARTASAESEVRPGPRPPTLRADQAEARQAEPEALHTSLPILVRPHWLRGRVALRCSARDCSPAGAREGVCVQVVAGGLVQLLR